MRGAKWMGMCPLKQWGEFEYGCASALFKPDKDQCVCVCVCRKDVYF